MKQGTRDWAIPITTAVIGAAIGILISQVFLQRTERISEATALRRSVVQLQYPDLRKVFELAQLGSTGVMASYRTAYVDRPGGKRLAEDAEGINVYLPHVLVASKERARYEQLLAHLDTTIQTLDPTLSERFEQIEAFLAHHPLPPLIFDSVVRSDYMDRSTVGRFLTLHDFLGSQTQRVMALGGS